MNKEEINNVRLGLFVAIAFVLFTVGVYNIGNKRNMFGSTFAVSSIFSNVKGLQPGNNVRYVGVNVGNVTGLVLLNDSTIRVDMQLQKRVREFLKKDAVASIGSDGLVGNMIVNINPGNGVADTVEDGDVLQSYSRPETEELLNSLGNTTENIGLLTLNLLQIAQNLNKGKGGISMLINDSTFAKDLKMTAHHLRRTSRNIDLVGDRLQANVDKMDRGEGLLGYLLKDSTVGPQIDLLSHRFDTIVRDRLTPMAENLQEASQDIAVAAQEMNSLVREIDFNHGLAGALLQDSAAANDLKQILRNLNEGTGLFNENMEAMRGNFLFRKYFKRQAKLEKKELPY